MFNLNCLNATLFYPYELKSAGEIWSQQLLPCNDHVDSPAKAMVTESGMKHQQSMVPISMASMTQRVMSDIKVFATQDGRTDTTDHIAKYVIHMDRQKLKKEREAVKTKQ